MTFIVALAKLLVARHQVTDILRVFKIDVGTYITIETARLFHLKNCNQGNISPDKDRRKEFISRLWYKD